MYQGIKKDDSVTSILLFIFNVFLTGQGIREIPIKAILKVFEPFEKSETAIRMGLSRGVHNNLLGNYKKGNEVYYRLTDQALASFKDWWKTLRQFKEKISLQRAGWDENWSIIVLKGKPSDEFIQEIRQACYENLNKELWVSPYDLSGKIVRLAKKNKLGLYLFQSKLLNNAKPENMVKEIWPVRELAKGYKQYVVDLNETTRGLNLASLKNGEGLPILHSFGLRILGLIKEDPQLPLELLPENWMGVHAVEEFFRVRELILPGANEYIKRALKGAPIMD